MFLVKSIQDKKNISFGLLCVGKKTENIWKYGNNLLLLTAVKKQTATKKTQSQNGRVISVLDFKPQLIEQLA